MDSKPTAVTKTAGELLGCAKRHIDVTATQPAGDDRSKEVFLSQASNSVAVLTQTVKASACLGKKPRVRERKGESAG